MVAIGEAGLDYHYDTARSTAQEQGFRRHIAAARETGLPLVIHSRDADADMARILEEETGKGAFPAVLHCFTGGPDLAERAIALGLYDLVHRNPDVQEIRRSACDCGQASGGSDPGRDRCALPRPRQVQGKRNEPSYVVETADVLASVRGVDRNQIAQQTTDNFFRLFAKVPRPQRSAA